jgi:hypothetical protein
MHGAISTVAAFESETIMQTLNLTGGDVKAAAKVLGIHRATLARKIAVHNINKKAVEGRRQFLIKLRLSNRKGHSWFHEVDGKVKAWIWDGYASRGLVTLFGSDHGDMLQYSIEEFERLLAAGAKGHGLVMEFAGYHVADVSGAQKCANLPGLTISGPVRQNPPVGKKPDSPVG